MRKSDRKTTDKLLSKITHANFGIDKDYPFLIGLQLRFSFSDSFILDEKTTYNFLLDKKLNAIMCVDERR